MVRTSHRPPQQPQPFDRQLCQKNVAYASSVLAFNLCSNARTTLASHTTGSLRPIAVTFSTPTLKPQCLEHSREQLAWINGLRSYFAPRERDGTRILASRMVLLQWKTYQWFVAQPLVMEVPAKVLGAAFSGLLVAFSGGLWRDSSTDVEGDFKVRDDEFTVPVVNMDAARYLKTKDPKKKGSESNTRQLTSVNPETCQLAQPPAFGKLQNQGFMLPTPEFLLGGMPSDKWHHRKEADRLAAMRIEALDSAHRILRN